MNPTENLGPIPNHIPAYSPSHTQTLPSLFRDTRKQGGIIRNSTDHREEIGLVKSKAAQKYSRGNLVTISEKTLMKLSEDTELLHSLIIELNIFT